MKFNVDEIASVIQKEMEQFDDRVDTREVGTVLEVGDGIARVYGLSNVMAGEMVEFPGGVIGLAFNLEENSVGVIILGDFLKIQEGDEVRASEHYSPYRSVKPSSDAWWIPWVIRWTGKGPIHTSERLPVEREAAGVAGRRPVHEPLQTGIKAIDAMTPIGRGQRELIIGDRKTGKTAVAIDAIINQKHTGVKCFYVAVGTEGFVGGRCDRGPATIRRDGLHDGHCLGSQHAALRSNTSHRTPGRRWRNSSWNVESTP